MSAHHRITQLQLLEILQLLRGCRQGLKITIWEGMYCRQFLAFAILCCMIQLQS